MTKGSKKIIAIFCAIFFWSFFVFFGAPEEVVIEKENKTIKEKTESIAKNEIIDELVFENEEATEMLQVVDGNSFVDNFFENNSEGEESTQVEEKNEMKNYEFAKVTAVMDGDTIQIEGGKRVRYIGIDTPETVHPSKPVECYGKEASDKNKEMVLGKMVRLEKDVSDTDRYGRLLRYVYVGDFFVNYELVRQGYANSYSYPPDIKYQHLFLEAQQLARAEKIGLWSSTCDSFESPDSAPASVTAIGDCVIKGNISASKEKIYHLPGCGSYEKTVIVESEGERWFCTEEEAVSAGWRKAKNCP